MTQLHKFVASDLRGAMKMTSQALERIHPSLDIYKELKKVDDELDSILMALEDGEEAPETEDLLQQAKDLAEEALGEFSL